MLSPIAKLVRSSCFSMRSSPLASLVVGGPSLRGWWTEDGSQAISLDRSVELPGKVRQPCLVLRDVAE